MGIAPYERGAHLVPGWNGCQAIIDRIHIERCLMPDAYCLMPIA